MKQFFEIMEKDFQKEGFTWREFVIYGVISPLAFIAIMGLAGWLETSCA